MSNLSIIAAVGNYITGKGWPIGRGGKIPWENTSDMKWFKSKTINNIVIMGNNTFKSIGSKPLKERVNIVVTHDKSYDSSDFQPDNEIFFADSLESAIDIAQSHQKGTNKTIFLIGGGALYKEAILKDIVDSILVDFIATDCSDADTFFPDIDRLKWEESSIPLEIEKGKAYAITYDRKTGANNHVDEQYLNIVKEIIEKGNVKDSRAGKVHSLFGRQMHFNLSDGFPILTTKKMFTRGIIHELIWFLSGSTNIHYLVKNNVHIWDDDAYRYYLERAKKMPEKLSKEEYINAIKYKTNFIIENNDGTYSLFRAGDLGPVYGHQWTNWNNSVNQIANIIDLLKNNPDDRRMLVSAWNPFEIPQMALPPCHYAFQFYSRKMTEEERLKEFKKRYPNDYDDNVNLDKIEFPKRKLSCMWEQRSCDFGLGVPFNITSYAILLSMIAQCVNMIPDELIFNGGDCHVYENQIEMLKEQLQRNPHKFGLPNLKLNPSITNINDFKASDITIEGYESYPAISMPLSVGK